MDRLEQKVKFFREALMDIQNSPESLVWYLRKDNWFEIFSEIERQHQEQYDEEGCIELCEHIFISRKLILIFLDRDTPDHEVLSVMKNLSQTLEAVSLQCLDNQWVIHIDVCSEILCQSKRIDDEFFREVKDWMEK